MGLKELRFDVWDLKIVKQHLKAQNPEAKFIWVSSKEEIALQIGMIYQEKRNELIANDSDFYMPFKIGYQYYTYFLEKGHLAKTYNANRNWYRCQDFISPAHLACAFLELPFEIIKNESISGFEDKFSSDTKGIISVKNILKQTYDMIINSIISGRLDATSPTLNQLLLPRNIKLINVIKWIDLERHIEPNFPLSLSDEIVGYIITKHEKFREMSEERGKTAQKELNISTIYDVCGISIFSYFALFYCYVVQDIKLLELSVKNDYMGLLTCELWAYCVNVQLSKNRVIFNPDGKVEKDIGYSKVHKAVMYACNLTTTPRGTPSKEDRDARKSIVDSLKKTLNSDRYELFRKLLSVVAESSVPYNL